MYDEFMRSLDIGSDSMVVVRVSERVSDNYEDIDTVKIQNFNMVVQDPDKLTFYAWEGNNKMWFSRDTVIRYFSGHKDSLYARKMNPIFDIVYQPSYSLMVLPGYFFSRHHVGSLDSVVTDSTQNIYHYSYKHFHVLIMSTEKQNFIIHLNRKTSEIDSFRIEESVLNDGFYYIETYKLSYLHVADSSMQIPRKPDLPRKYTRRYSWTSTMY